MINSFKQSTPRIIREGANGSFALGIEDELLKSREIFLTDEVDADSMESLFKQITYLHRSDPNKEITLYINSPGGDVQSGLAVYDLLTLIKTPIKTVCIGTAASMGALLFLAGDKRAMFPHSKVMIHDPAHKAGSLGGMKPAELEERLLDLKKTQKILCEIIAETTGKTIEDVHAKTCKDSFFDAEESLDYGLATEIITKLK